MGSNPEDGETDIYDDLPNFQFDETFRKLEKDKAYLQNKVEELGAKLEEMKKENEKLATKVKNLGKNISCLYKTAQREIERKEKIIADLRKERDDLLFRRGLQDSKAAYTRRPSRKQLTPTKKVRNGGIKRIFDGKGKLGEAVNVSSITPSSQEYAKICAGAEKIKNTVNIEVPLNPEIIDIIDSETNDECSADIKSTKQVKRLESQVLNSNKSSEIAESEERTASPLCDARKPDITKRREEQIVGSRQKSEVPLDEGKILNALSNNSTVGEAAREELRTASSNHTPEVAVDEGKPSRPPSDDRNIEVTTPVKDKISVHMSSEDCGFGRRRVRRVIKPSLSPATPLAAEQEERGIKRPLEETQEPELGIWKKPQLLAVEVTQADPRVQKRRCVEGALQGENHHDDLGKSEVCTSTAGKGEVINETGSSCQNSSGDLLVLSYSASKCEEINGITSTCDQRTSGSMRQEEREPKGDKCDNFNKKGGNDRGIENIDTEVAKLYGSSFGVSAFGGNTNSVTHSAEHISPREPDGKSSVNRQKVITPKYSSSIEKEMGCINNQMEENVQGDNGHSYPSPLLSPTLSGASDNRSLRHSPCGSRMTDDELSSRRSWDRERVSRSSGFRDKRVRCLGESASDCCRKSCSQGGRGELEGQGRMDRQVHSYKESGAIIRSGKKVRPHLGKNGDRNRGTERSRDNDREKIVDRDRDGERVRNYPRERSGDRDNERVRDCDGVGRRDRDRGKSRERSIDRDRRRSRERSIDHDRRRSGERSTDRDRRRSRERSTDRDRRRSRERSTDRDRRRSRERSTDRDRRRDYDRERSWDRDRARSRDRKRGRSRDCDKRSRDYDVERSRDCDSDKSDGHDRERSRDHEKDSERSRDNDRPRDNEKGRVYDRRRESDRSFNRGRDSYQGRDPGRFSDLDRSQDSDRGRETSRGSKDSDRSRESGRSRDSRRFRGCRSRSREGSPGSGGGKESCQGKKSSGRQYDLREKLNESNSPIATDKGGGKRWNGYKDWDKPKNEDNERNERWCAKKPNTHDIDGIRSPDKQRNSNPRECRPFTPEWD